MLRRLAALVFLALPVAAQDAPFLAELTPAFTYESFDSDEPLVVVNGQPSSAFTYHGEGVNRGLNVLGTRYFGPVADDGTTPFALLPFVARASSARGSVGLVARSRDSSGTSRGADVTLTSQLTGDQHDVSASLGGEWYFHPDWAARLSGSFRRARSTDNTIALESPSGRGGSNGYGQRTSNAGVVAGLGWRIGDDHFVALDGGYTGTDTRRTDQVLLTNGPFRTYEYERSGDTWSASMSARSLFLSRRLQVDALASYSDTEGSLDDLDIGRRLEDTASLVRRVEGTVTYYPSRALGLFVAAGYASQSDTAGLTAEFRILSAKTVSFAGGGRWFFTARHSALLRVGWVDTDTVTPPDSSTYQQLEDTTLRVELAAAFRF